jgi:hypothetical protein
VLLLLLPEPNGFLRGVCVWFCGSRRLIGVLVVVVVVGDGSVAHVVQ